MTAPLEREPGREVASGREAIELPGFTYLPRFVTASESEELIDYFGQLRPLWEVRHAGERHARDGQEESARSRRLTRPVYWLGAWQFACLGYYSAPDHVEERAARAEPFPPAMEAVLGRLGALLRSHGGDTPPNTCLINYYGSEVEAGPPRRVRDVARLRQHRDSEPGPVVMLSIGQPALFEFVDADDPDFAGEPALSVWLRHRSLVVLSGDHFKDRLHHRVVRVRHGSEPAMASRLPDFNVRRVSVSFRTVPEDHVRSISEFASPARRRVLPYLEQLAERSEHFRAELDRTRVAEQAAALTAGDDADRPGTDA